MHGPCAHKGLSAKACPGSPRSPVPCGRAPRAGSQSPSSAIIPWVTSPCQAYKCPVPADNSQIYVASADLVLHARRPTHPAPAQCLHLMGREVCRTPCRLNPKSRISPNVPLHSAAHPWASPGADYLLPSPILTEIRFWVGAARSLIMKGMLNVLLPLPPSRSPPRPQMTLTAPCPSLPSSYTSRSPTRPMPCPHHPFNPSPYTTAQDSSEASLSHLQQSPGTRPTYRTCLSPPPV